MSKPVYIFPHSDFKFRCWAAALPEELFKSSKGPYWNWLYIILKHIYHRDRIIVFYRYLNIGKGLSHELAKLSIDIIIVFLAMVRLIEIRWIVHNVDKESESRHRLIVQAKRFLLSKVARYFYVTSNILKEGFPYNRAKLKVVTFGRELSSKQKEKGTEKLTKLINEWKSKHKNTPRYIGVVTNWGDKEHDSLRLINLILSSDKNGLIGLVYLGKKTNIDSEFLLEVNDRYEYFLKDLNVDFVLKTLDDRSVPYTLYSAATAGIPMVSSSRSYFSKDLITYRLGGIIESTKDLVSIILDYDVSHAESYLNEHCWKYGAESLIFCDVNKS